jgi:hypothetical protein
MNKQRSRRVWRLGWLLPLLSALGLTHASAHPPSEQNPARAELEARVLAVRSALGSTAAQAMSEESPATGKAEKTSQWSNWPNWGNWNNWPNWGNWGNWFNR